jgi:hypothetical protein
MLTPKGRVGLAAEIKDVWMVLDHRTRADRLLDPQGFFILGKLTSRELETRELMPDQPHHQ